MSILRPWVAVWMFAQAACAASVLAATAEPRAEAPEPVLKSIYAGVHNLGELKTPQTKAIVLVFLDTECPIAQQQLPRLKELHRKMARQGVAIAGIYSNTRVNIWSMAVHAHDSDIPFPVFQDVDQGLADRFGVQRTPEIVVLDKKLKPRYQGPIDNQFKRGGNLAAPTENYLEDALSAMLRGEAVQRAHVPTSGCPLGRQKPLIGQQDICYHRDVLPIFQRHCQTCHRAGGVGPFQLACYADAFYNAERIAEVVGERLMPPWHGLLNPEFGTLHNDKSLSDAEIGVLTSWVAQGAPEGNCNDAPPPVKWPGPNDWEIGRPDFVYKMPTPFRVPKSGVIEYQFFRVPVNRPHDSWYQAAQVKPGNAEVVHHVAIHLVPSGDQQFQGPTAMAQLYGLNTQKGNVIFDYVPGDTHNAKTFDPGQAGRIPKNHDLIYELHYTPNNRAATMDQSMVAFKWAKQPPEHEVLGRVFRKPVGRFRIPPNDPHCRMEVSYHFDKDVDVDAIRPHFHLRGKSFRVEIVERDPETGEIEKRQTVLSVPRYDQRWQRMYELSTPLRVTAGTELLGTAHFDNSRFNPANPDPSAEVLWGQQTSDEMFSARFRYRVVTADKN